MVIRTVGQVLSALMIYGVGYKEVTHPAEHNPVDGGHKTVQAQAGGRREDTSVLADGHRADGGSEDRCRTAEPLARLASGMDDVKALLAQLCAGVVGLAMGPPIGRKASRQPAGRHAEDLKPETVKVLPNRPKAAGNVFCQAGEVWDVTFDGGKTFHLRHTLGVKYLNYLLHRPGLLISAFDLEIAIRPDKARARAKDSIQNHLDAEAVRDYLRQLDRLRAQRAEAAEDGDPAATDRLDEDICAIEWELTKNRQAPDAGERARNNVRKAIAVVQAKLRNGSDSERRFGQHLEQFMSLGYECCYYQPPGMTWT